MTLDLLRRHAEPAVAEFLTGAGWPMEYVDAAGCHITDRRGRRYLDLIAGYGTAVLGHRHPRVTCVLTTALEEGPPVVTALAASPEVGQLAERLSRLAGSRLCRAHFVTGGGEALDAALSLAALVTGRPEFVAFHSGFHGLTIATLGLTSTGRRSPALSRVAPRAHLCPHGDLDRLAEILATRRVAAVVLEVIQGLGGATTWASADLDALRQLCDRAGTLIIVDEVLTGLGRTGSWFAHRTASGDLAPDLMVVSKALGAGTLPMACVLMTEPVFQKGRAGTGGVLPGPAYAGYLLGTRCALTVLDVLEEYEIPARVTALGARFEAGLRRLQAAGGIAAYEGRGLLFAVQIATADAAGVRQTAAACSGLFARGFRTQPCAYAPWRLLLTPPLVIEEAQIDAFLDALADTTRESVRADHPVSQAR
jgi:acetylornithine/succinyldiaminopimelate/putrescine aminotransferase